jgi:hypothetical protein
MLPFSSTVLDFVIQTHFVCGLILEWLKIISQVVGTLPSPGCPPDSLFHALSLILPHFWHGPHVLIRIRIGDGDSTETA